ncbi:MAG: hypothetical protein GXO63_03060 [Candidatus Micrarchaeota archaeon]|nr:hypothetical protein [Candidatus Micrarchaeota archaeon]
MKGQVKLEFIFSFVFFTILVFYLSMQINSNVSTVASDSYIDTMMVRANTLAEILVRTPGVPTNWENNVQSTKYVGLASTPFNLSKAKVSALNNNCWLMEKMVSGGYRVIIYTSSGVLMLECGYGGPEVKARVTRPVNLEGESATLILEVW